VISIKTLLKDAVGWSLFQFARPFLNFYIPRRAWLARVRDLLDNYGISIVPHHYYEPVYTSADLIRDPSAPRALDGIDWNDEGQLKLLGDFRFADDLRQLEGRAVGGNVFRYDNGAFEAGDAEALYCMIRQFKPKNFVEIGCGQSTLVAQFAFEDCAKDDPACMFASSRLKTRGWTHSESKSDANGLNEANLLCSVNWMRMTLCSSTPRMR
jgi:hypothetical protein